MKRVQIFVHPSFKKKLKRKAADDGVSMIKLSKLIANGDDEEFNEVCGWKKNDTKKKKYVFSI